MCIRDRFKSNLVEQKNIVKSISLLETTSPSALLLASCEESIKDWLDKDNSNSSLKNQF